MNKIGIDAIGFYTSHYYLDLTELAKVRGIDVSKFNVGLGQYEMSVPAPDEDIVTMGANAALKVLDKVNVDDIDTFLFATESSFDQAKSAGTYIHRLLKLPSQCRIVELKQACYSATAALQMAVALVGRYPDKKVLIISSDIARYPLNSPAESSQGCGAVAFIVSTNPRILEIEPAYGVFSEDIMDFWRPNYSDAAIVYGKYSSQVYLRSLEKVWNSYKEKANLGFDDITFHCYHSPMPRLVEKAHKLLCKINGDPVDEVSIKTHMAEALMYARMIGNSYTAALYISFASLLDHHDENMAGKRVGFYSYGSGCVAEYFAGIVQEGYQTVLETKAHQKMLQTREAISYIDYEKFYNFHLPTDGSIFETPHFQTGRFRLKGMENHQRLYEEVIKPVKKKRRVLTNETTNETYVIKATSPGKLILSGEHSVVHGGPALALAIDRFATTTVSPQLSKMISFHLLTFRYKDSFTIQTLREVKDRLIVQYQRFLNGEIGIREVLQTPFELTQYALMNVLDHVNKKIIDGLNIQTCSDIPVGCGMGSSAASILSVLFAISRYCKMNLQQDKYLKLGFDAEKLQHGYTSGLDLYTSLHGGCVYYQNGQASQRELPQVPMFIVNTGSPSVGTGECVMQVNQQFNDSPIWKSFEAITNEIDQALQNNDFTEMKKLIQENHRLLNAIGVVPENIQQFINDVESVGAAAKICGAGAVKGEHAGAVLVLSDDEKRVKPICDRYGYEVSSVKGVLQGSHAV